MMSHLKWWKPDFKRKADLESEIRNRVKNATLEAPLPRGDEGFLLWVLSHHHEFSEKRGAGIKHIEVRKNRVMGKTTRGLWLVRTDGSSIDISWVTALKPSGRNEHTANVVRAARQEIKSQIDAFRQQAPCECELCGGKEADTHWHVDHVDHFEDLLFGFLGGVYSDVKLVDEGLTGRFADRHLAYDWQTFHENNARLRLVHAICNLRRGKQ